MKKEILTLLFLFSMAVAHAQQDYKALLNTFYLHAETNFKDISGEQSDSSAFSPSKLDPDIGVVKIGRFPNAVTLNWTIPLAQSKNIQAAVKDFMKTAYSDSKLYKTLSDGTEDEGDIITNVYTVDTAKPLLIFQTVYYKNSEDPEKSRFVITMYGK